MPQPEITTHDALAEIAASLPLLLRWVEEAGDTADIALRRRWHAPAATFSYQTTAAVDGAGQDLDGIADLFVGNFSSRTVTLLLGDGRGGFSLSATRAVQGSPWMIVAGDIDGDGHADVAVCNSNRSSASASERIASPSGLTFRSNPAAARRST